TFYVDFIPLPEVPALVYGCPGHIQIKIHNREEERISFHYILEHQESGRQWQQSGSGSVTLNNLIAGDYALNIRTEEGCDTTITIRAAAYPVPEVRVSPADTTIKYGDTVQVHAEGAAHYFWSPPDV